MNSQASRFTDENAHVQFSQLVKHRTSLHARHLELKLQLEPSDYPRGRGRGREGRGGVDLRALACIVSYVVVNSVLGSKHYQLPVGFITTV